MRLYGRFGKRSGKCRSGSGIFDVSTTVCPVRLLFAAKRRCLTVWTNINGGVKELKTSFLTPPIFLFFETFYGRTTNRIRMASPAVPMHIS